LAPQDQYLLFITKSFCRLFWRLNDHMNKYFLILKETIIFILALASKM